MSEILKDGFHLMHPIRYKIIQILRDKNRAMYIDEIAKFIDVDRRLTSYHLTTLEKLGFAESMFDVIKKPTAKGLGKAGRFYSITPKVDEVLGELARILEKL